MAASCLFFMRGFSHHRFNCISPLVLGGGGGVLGSICCCQSPLVLPCLALGRILGPARSKIQHPAIQLLLLNDFHTHPLDAADERRQRRALKRGTGGTAGVQMLAMSLTEPHNSSTATGQTVKKVWILRSFRTSPFCSLARCWSYPVFLFQSFSKTRCRSSFLLVMLLLCVFLGCQ